MADKDDEFLRVQVKKANQNNEKPWKYQIFTDRYEKGEVNLFASYIVDEDEVFYAAFDEVGSKEFRINTRKREEMIPSNTDRAKLLEDYTLKRAFSKLQENRDYASTRETASDHQTS